MIIYRGQTLLSVMIALSLSMMLLMSVSAFYSYSQQQNKQILLHLYLQSELQRTIQLLGKDIRRSGFRAISDKLVRSNFDLFEQDKSGKSIVVAQADNEPSNSCVLFIYDLDATGCVGTTYRNNVCVRNKQNTAREIERELFGYRLNKQMIETRLTYKNSISANCNQKQCQSYLQQPACNSGGWVDLLDENDIAITALKFNWIADYNGLEVYLKGHLKRNKQVEYETSAIIPLLNQKR
nr:type II secretion system protein J [Histophilus somni]